jgi:macrodomain Ter protein organizer (MatP/YcbG family)
MIIDETTTKQDVSTSQASLSPNKINTLNKHELTNQRQTTLSQTIKARSPKHVKTHHNASQATTQRTLVRTATQDTCATLKQAFDTIGN